MGDILTPKRQTVVDRLRRRIEFYRDHQESCYPRYENTCGGFYSQQRQETQVLRQRYLESKAKKSKKEHRNVKDSNLNSDGQRGLLGQQKFAKRALDTSSSNADAASDEHEQKPKIIRTCKTPEQSSSDDKAGPKDFPPQQQQQQQQKQSSIPSFSGAMLMQQFTSINSQVQHSTNKAIQANSSTDNVSQMAKTDALAVGPMCLPTKGSDVLSTASIAPLENIVCKQERETDTNQCSNAISATTVTTVTTDATCSALSAGSTGSCDRFSDPLSNLGFPDDSTDDMINVDILNDFLDGVDVLPDSSEFMKGFSFDDAVTSDKDDKDPISLINGECRKSTDVVSQQQQSFSPRSASQSLLYLGISLSPPQSSVEFDTTVTASSVNNPGLVPTSVSNSCFDQSQHTASFGPNNSLGMGQQNMGFDFKLKDPSPAAQTLKQLAEQHQNMQQKQHLQHQQSQGHFGVDTFGGALPPLHMSFLNNSSPSLANPNSSTMCQKNTVSDLFSADVFKQAPFDTLTQNDLFKPDVLTSSFLGANSIGSVSQQPDLNVRQDLPIQAPRRGGRGQATAPSKALYNVDLDQKPCVGSTSNFCTSRSSPHLTDQPGISHNTPSTTSLATSFMSTSGVSVRTSSPQYTNMKQSPHVMHMDNNSHQMQLAAGKQKLQSVQGKSLDLAQALKQQSTTTLAPPSVFRGFPCGVSNNFQVSSSTQQQSTYPSQCSSNSVVTTCTSLLQTMSDTLDVTNQLPKHRMVTQQTAGGGVSLSSQHGDDVFFLTCPPPEYKPQVPSTAQVPSTSTMGNINANTLLPMVLNSNPSFGMQSERPLGGLVRTYVENATPTNQSSHPLPSKLMSVSPLSSQSALSHSSLNSSGVLPSYSQASQMNLLSSQSLGSTAAKPLYTTTLSHDQRAPPNVNIGPDGLNMGQMGPMIGSADWKQHSLIPQNVNPPRGGASLNSAEQKMHIRFSRAPQQTNFVTGPLNSNTSGPRQLAPRNFVSQQSLGLPGAADPMSHSSHLTNQLIPQTPQQQSQMGPRSGGVGGTVAQNQGLNVQMQSSTSSMNMRSASSAILDQAMFQNSGVSSSLGSLSANVMQESTSLTLDYLNSIDGNASLMNFDQVMQGSGAFNLLEDMGVLGK